MDLNAAGCSHTTRHGLSLPDCRSRRCVCRRLPAENQTWPARLVRPGECDHRSRRAAPSARDLNLRARQVELCAAGGLRLMERDALNSHEILPARDTLGDCERDYLLVCGVASVWHIHTTRYQWGWGYLTVCRPGEAARLAPRIDSVDGCHLEPDIARRLPGIDVSTLGSLRHVELHRSGVRYPLVGNKAEVGTGSNGGSPRTGPHLEATYIGAVYIVDPMVVLVVLCLADRCPFLLLGDAIDHDLRESVWYVLAVIRPTSVRGSHSARQQPLQAAGKKWGAAFCQLNLLNLGAGQGGNQTRSPNQKDTVIGAIISFNVRKYMPAVSFYAMVIRAEEKIPIG